jgi:ABC-type transport system involved in multi-copper enzyme maturation permease subunit
MTDAGRAGGPSSRAGEVLTAGPPEQAGPPRPTGDSGGTWSLTVGGVVTVVRLELRQRVRATRWVVVLVVWTALLALLTGLLWLAFGSMSDNGLDDEETGATLFGVIVFLVLSLGSLVAPALSATSINGDRNAGMLATLQTTLLSPAEIAIGKLLAAWTTALALFVTSAPFVFIAYLAGGTPVGRLIVTLLLLALMLGVVCAVALGWSAIASRPSSSSVLTYLTVALMGVGLPLLFALSLPFVTSTEEVTVLNADWEPGVTETRGRCVAERVTEDVAHTERTWWILAASPYVVVADAAPRPPGDRWADDPLSGIRDGVRELRLGPEDVRDSCTNGEDPVRQAQRDDLSPTWPFGLAFNLLLAIGFVVVTVRRLRTPMQRLPRGTRVA